MSTEQNGSGWRGGSLPKKVILKVGSALLTPSGPLGGEGLQRLSAEVKALQQRGVSVTVVSSGAIAQGRLTLGLSERPSELAAAQALAALGQPLLMRRWAEAFAPTQVAQVLLTMSDVLDPLRFYNARCALRALEALGVIAIGNENDTVATEEIKFGDNDRLGAYLAQINSADLLILYTQVDGLYTANPKRDPSARKLEVIEELSEVLSFAEGADMEGWGTGGMKTKLEAAQLAHEVGTSVLIADGATSLIRLLEEPSLGSLIPAPRAVSQSLLRRWPVHGLVELSERGLKSLQEGAPAELTDCLSVTGHFSRGDLVELRSGGAVRGRALIGYGEESCVDVQRWKQGATRRALTDGPLVHPEDWAPY